MASRLMHLAVSQRLEKVLHIKDVNDFRVGQILPDAVIGADKKEVNSHFTKIIDGGKRKCFDFHTFYDRYRKEIIFRELYLGYYFHLIEDNIFRIMIYHDLNLLSRRVDPQFLEELYGDYHILNGIIAENYVDDNNLHIPQGFSDMTLNEIYSFEILEFIEDMTSDFEDRIPSEPLHLSREFLGKYIDRCSEVCQAEYEALRHGKHSFSLYELSFRIK